MSEKTGHKIEAILSDMVEYGRGNRMRIEMAAETQRHCSSACMTAMIYWVLYLP